MKLIRHVIIATVIVASAQTPATSHENYAVDTTAAFVELCGVSTDDPTFDAAMGFCLGYIDAVIDYHQALAAGPKYDRIVCPETNVTREEIIAVLIDWSSRNEQYLNGESPVHGVMRAAVEKWPCSK